VNSEALYDALNCASYAVVLAEGGNQPKAEEAYMEASVAAMDAFEEDSPEAAALNLILGAVGALAQGCAA
jgi:hypothetical protein